MCIRDSRKDGTLSYLRPDGKTQVTVEYDEAGKPIRIDAVVCSTQHDPEVTQEQIHEDIKKYVFDAIIPADMVDENTKYFINPTGRFVIGGPHEMCIRDSDTAAAAAGFSLSESDKNTLVGIYNKFKNIDIDEDSLRTQVNKIYDKLESLGITKEDVKGILGKLIDLVKSIIN